MKQQFNIHLWLVFVVTTLMCMSCQKEEPCDDRTKLDGVYTEIVGEWELEYIHEYTSNFDGSFTSDTLYLSEQINLNIYEEGSVMLIINESIVDLDCVKGWYDKKYYLESELINKFRLTTVLNENKYLKITTNTSSPILKVSHNSYSLPYRNKERVTYQYCFLPAP